METHVASRRSERRKSDGGLRIIVADDDRRMREFYQEVLARMGHEVVATAEDGRELVDVCLTTPADLVVSDIRMPDIDGVHAAQIVARRVKVPFLFVSAYRDEYLIDEAELDVSVGHLVKPVKQEDLAQTIPEALRRFRRRRR